MLAQLHEFLDDAVAESRDCSEFKPPGENQKRFGAVVVKSCCRSGLQYPLIQRCTKIRTF